MIAPESVTTVIEFQIKRNGSLGKVATVETAGYDPLDAAATQAILSSEPFERLPEAYREKALKIRMHFGSEQPVSAERHSAMVLVGAHMRRNMSCDASVMASRPPKR